MQSGTYSTDRSGPLVRSDQRKRGKWWHLSNEEVEQALLNFIEETTGEKLPPREEIDIQVESSRLLTEVLVTGK